MVADWSDPNQDADTRPSPSPEGRLEGYQPKRPLPASGGEQETPPQRDRVHAPRPRPARPSAPRDRRGRGRTFNTAMVTAVAAGALLLGLIVGWMARGGPPKAELVITTQAVPAVTVTKEVAP